MSNSEIKEIVVRMMGEADAAQVRWPMSWKGEGEDSERQKKGKECLLALQSCPKIDGKWNEAGALSQVFLKFGCIAPAASSSSSSSTSAKVKDEGDIGISAGADNDDEEVEVPKQEIKEASKMSLSQLKKTLKKLGLEKETEDFIEKSNFIELLESHRAKHGTRGEEVKPRKKRVKSEEEGEDGESPKKKKKDGPLLSETFGNEANKPAYLALKELAGLYFQTGENFKGGVYSKAAKAVRETEEHLTETKAIVKLKIKGVGKGTAAICEEIVQNGFCDKLEKMRAGEV